MSDNQEEMTMDYTLSKGSHGSPEQGRCAMEVSTETILDQVRQATEPRDGTR